MKLRTQGKPVTVRSVKANLGVAAEYRRRLDRMIEEMQDSLDYWIKAAYRANPPRALLAQDAAPANSIQAAMDKLARRWKKNFAKGAAELAEYFTKDATQHANRSLQAILRDAGFTVRFKMTPAVNDAYQAVIAENVGLIKSIAEKHLTDVQGMVMRSVAAGRDLGPLAKDLRQAYGVTRRRAALIARDQNNKATAVITKTRQEQLGIYTAKWKHSHAGITPRPSHLLFDGKVYDTRKGAYLDGEWVFPGQLINCRCTSQSIIPGLEDDDD